jgi:SAM-dependent methyltransferase
LTRKTWEAVGAREAPSWYLDPLVGQQKREVNIELVSRWSAGRDIQTVLKTDLFEEAFGCDQLLPGLFPAARLVCGIDQSAGVTRVAAGRFPSLAAGVSVMDVSMCGFRDGAFDLVISTSTLDHFSGRAAFLTALAELARVLRPGGLLIITLDNPLNPLYHPLKWASRLKSSPFPLGYTPAPATLRADLATAGLAVEDEDWILHNPRGLSTALFLAIRKTMGERADSWIARLLSVFASLGNLPTRRFTACFYGVAARRP